LEFAIGHIGPQHADPACMVAAEPGNRIECDAVIDVVEARRDDNRASRADARLEALAVVVGACVRNEFSGRAGTHETRIVDVHVRVARERGHGIHGGHCVVSRSLSCVQVCPDVVCRTAGVYASPITPFARNTAISSAAKPLFASTSFESWANDGAANGSGPGV